MFETLTVTCTKLLRAVACPMVSLMMLSLRKLMLNLTMIPMKMRRRIDRRTIRRMK